MIGERVFGRTRPNSDRVRRRRRAGPNPSAARGRGPRNNAGKRNRQALRNQALPILKLRLGARWITIPLLAVTSWMLVQTLSEPQFRVQKPDVIGTSITSPSRIRSIAGLKYQYAFEVDPDAIVQQLEALPEIASATVRISWPNEVMIEIEERLPVLEWNDAGTTWWISKDGIAFLRRSVVHDLIQVQSLERTLGFPRGLEPVLSPEVIGAALALQENLEDQSQLFYDKDRGFGFRDPRGWMAYFGTYGDIEAKVNVYFKIVELLDMNGYPARLVSVENLKAAFYR